MFISEIKKTKSCFADKNRNSNNQKYFTNQKHLNKLVYNITKLVLRR